MGLWYWFHNFTALLTPGAGRRRGGSLSPWAHYPHSLRGTAHRGRSRREWLEYAKNRKRNKKDIKLSFLC
nr:MAG TPA: hypothetical protein [Caudoviricetes sp.]